MFEAYKIGVRIGVVDRTRGSILKLASQFAKAQKEASAFLKTLMDVNAELRRPTSWASSAAADFRNARREAEGYARASRSARGAGGAAASGSAGVRGGGLAIIGTGMALSGAAMARSGGGRGTPPLLGGGSGGFPRLPGSGSGGIPGLPGGRGANAASLPGTSFFAMAGRGGSGMPPRGGGGGNGGQNNPNAAFTGIAGGMLTAEAGREMLGMLEGPIEQASDYQRAVAKFSLFGLGDKLNKQAIQFATSMNIVGTSMTQAVEFMTEAQGVFRESGLNGPEALAGAKLAAPILAKINFATASLDATSRARMATQSLDMLRFIESDGGLSSPKRFNQLAEAGWKAIRSSGGNVNWSQLRQFLSTSSVAGKGLSDTALFGELEPIIGELKGGAAGHGLMTAYSRLNGLQRLMPRIFTHEALRLGLWDRSKLTFNSQGGVKDIRGNPLNSSALFSSDPVQWYEKVVLPAYQKAGIVKQNDVFRENAILFGNTGSKLFSLVYQQQANIANSVQAQKKTLGINASVGAAKNTLAGQMQEYHADMESLQTAWGQTILPMLVEGLKVLTPLLKDLTQWMRDSPTTVRILTAAFASLGATLVIGGALTTVASGFSLLRLSLGGGTLASSITGAASAMNGLKLACAAFVAWEVGSLIGKLLSDHGNKETQDAMGDKNATIGGTAYERINPFNPKTGKREFSFGGLVSTFWNPVPTASDATTIKSNNLLEANYHRVWQNGGWLTPKQAMQWDAARASATPGTSSGTSPYVPSPKQTQTIQVNSTVNLDGKAVAKAVTTHQVDAATGPQTGMSSFDSSMFPAYIGMNN